MSPQVRRKNTFRRLLLLMPLLFKSGENEYKTDNHIMIYIAWRAKELIDKQRVLLISHWLLHPTNGIRYVYHRLYYLYEILKNEIYNICTLITHLEKYKLSFTNWLLKI